ESGHAVEARLNAEDPDRDFAPSPGRITRLVLPSGPGIRVDTGVSEGDTIPADFDSMIAKVIAYGRDRAEALGRLRRAMAETTVIIEGGATNKSFVLELLHQREVIDAQADTGWIDRVRAAGGLVSHRHSTVALVAAAIETYEQDERFERERLLSTASGGRPQVQHRSGLPVDFKLRGATYRVRVARTGAHRFRVGVEAGADIITADAELDRFDRHVGQIAVNDVRYRLLTSTHGPVHLIEVDGVAHRVSRDEGGVLRSPMPALVVATPLAVGAEVESGAPVLILESMKMETVLRAPFRARLKECVVSVGTQVETGAPLLRLEPIGDGDAAADTPATAAAVTLDLPADPAGIPFAERLARGQSDLRSLLLGFDVDPHDERRVLDSYLAARGTAIADGHRPLAAELGLLEVFADLAELSRNRPAGEDIGVGSRVLSAREHFHTYLQSLDVERAALSAAFEAKLAKALGHYGITDLQRTPELEAAVFRIFLAQQRATADATVISTLLRAWLQEPPPDDAMRAPVGLVLERLLAATQVRFPVVSDLARGLIFAWFAQPLLRRNRAAVYAGVRKHLRHLDAHPDAPDRAERIADMVRSTEPLVRLLGQRLTRDNLNNTVMLEVLTRRYYGNKALLAVRTAQAGGCTFVVAARSGSSVVSAAVSFDALGDALRGLAGLARAGDAIDADLYLAWENQPQDVDEMAAALHAVIREIPLPQVARLTTTVAGRAGAVIHHHFTFRPTADGMSEHRLIRGLHPSIAQRMQLERLSKFDLTRLPSADEEVYLFQAVARDNPADDRLVAFAQVRDLTELRDDDGRLAALPTAEDTIAACLDSIRRARALRTVKNSFPTNRIVIYIWPPVEFTRAEIDTIAARVLPTTAGAGLEEILFITRMRDQQTGALTKVALRGTFAVTDGSHLTIGPPSTELIEPLDGYRQKVLRATMRNTVYPYELIGLLGSFVEHDLDPTGALVPVDRPKGSNSAGIVAGVITTVTEQHPAGITRVILLGDPTKSLGAVAEPECRRIIAALDLAERMQVPLEWYALSAGARISMESGTENMDWVAAALKRIVDFTQAGGEINVVVAGINVGAQPYWNAEATMLMHTKGILVMTPDSAMVLTGKQSLDFSGGVSAEDNFGIGGYDRVMGPNGQAQYWAPDLPAARDVLMAHYAHSYVAPGEAGPRRAVTSDPVDRDICDFPHAGVGSEFTTVGEIFSAEANPD
ncbi:MAG TPA: biotin/lipoyl-containing protein, partial [Actinoplanes sp.]|nr:biotin/lipoyl-containing protein [Actinoplanes sp.]